MLNYKITKVAFVLVLITLPGSSRCSADVREQSQQFLDTFCVSCHGQAKAKAGLRLDQIDKELSLIHI